MTGPTPRAATRCLWGSSRVQLECSLEACRVGDTNTNHTGHEAAFDLAKLTLWLEDRMIEKKTAAVPIDQISPDTEAQFITSPVGVERLDKTARIMADRIWKPLCSKWWNSIRLFRRRRGRQSSGAFHRIPQE
jgi:hypothetical protein